VKFASNCVEDIALDVTQSLKPGEVALLENLRFHPEEKAGDEFFAGQLAENGTVYINDAFGTAHRAHASTAVIAKFFPEDKAFGLLLAKEIDALEKYSLTHRLPYRHHWRSESQLQTGHHRTPHWSCRPSHCWRRHGVHLCTSARRQNWQ
jgi:hypothetical protein